MAVKFLNEPQVDIKELVDSFDFKPAVDIIKDEYYRQGYDGEFGRTADLRLDTQGSSLQLVLDGPAYTPFMLYGRKPGKMPPLMPILNWMNNVGMTGNPWTIMNSIASNGTKGNDFITPVMPKIADIVKEEIQSKVASIVQQSL